jgi:hypothetical protein
MQGARLKINLPAELQTNSLAVLEPIKAPWIRPGVVVHEPMAPVDGLLAEFALVLKDRGFNISGFVQRNNTGGEEPGTGCAPQIEFYDLGNGSTFVVDRDVATGSAVTVAARHLRKAMREDADLVVISRLSAFETAAKSLKTTLGDGISQGMPVLSSIAGRCVGKWPEVMNCDSAMITADLKSLWRWWGPERLYRDLSLAVADDEVRQIVCGPRWIMVEGPYGTGLAYLPRNPRELLPQLPRLRRLSLRQLAGLSQSWDPVEMALGIAAINAHTNRYDLDGRSGNGTQALSHLGGRVVAIGAFPGLADILPDCAVIETDPRPGEFPIVAMDTLLPGCGAAVVNSSALINRNLPRILRLAQGSRIALVGPSTPLTPRLYAYGLDILGGLVISDPNGLAAAIRAGATPREFGRFGRYLHIKSSDAG